VDLPSLNQSVACSLGNKCTDITCCVESDRVPSSFNVHMNFDLCQQVVNVDLEKFHFEIQMKDFVYGSSISFG